MQGHIIPSFPVFRPRRLRQSPALRRLVSETQLNPRQLVLPLFVRPGRKVRQPVGAMPGVFQLSPDELLKEATEAFRLGVPAILLFGLPAKKDERASEAFARNGIVQQTVRLLKKELPELLVITDVCLCEYMSHGHCGVVHSGKKGTRILNDPTLKILARTAVSHAEAGADIVAPSDMMDGRVRAIRAELDRGRRQEVHGPGNGNRRDRDGKLGLVAVGAHVHRLAPRDAKPERVFMADDQTAAVPDQLHPFDHLGKRDTAVAVLIRLPEKQERVGGARRPV